MDLLISLAITALIFYVIYLIVMKLCAALKVDATVVQIIQIIFWLVALIWALRVLGVWGGGPYYYYGHRGY